MDELYSRQSFQVKWEKKTLLWDDLLQSDSPVKRPQTRNLNPTTLWALYTNLLLHAAKMIAIYANLYTTILYITKYHGMIIREYVIYDNINA